MAKYNVSTYIYSKGRPEGKSKERKPKLNPLAVHLHICITREPGFPLDINSMQGRAKPDSHRAKGGNRYECNSHMRCSVSRASQHHRVAHEIK